MIRKIVFLILLIGFVWKSSAQNEGVDRTILPSIMILPGKSEYKDVRNIEIPFNLKVGMATVNDAMKNFGFDTKDFEASYAKLRRDGKLDDCDTCDIKDLFFQEATADVLVELEFEYIKTPDGNKVTVIVEAFHFSTSTSWASEVCESNYFRTPDISALTKSAINMINYEDDDGNELSYIDNFMLEIVNYLDNCMVSGAIADIRFTMDSGSGCDMNCKVNDKRLKYLLEDWVEKTAKDGEYKIQSESDNQLIVDEYRYDCDKLPSRIGRKLSRFLDELNIEFNLTRSRSTLYVTLINI